MAYDANGIATYTYWLAKGLAKDGHKIFVLTTGDEAFESKTLSDNVTLWHIPVGNVHYYSAKIPFLRRFASWIKHQEIGASAGRIIERLDTEFGIDIVEAYGAINLIWKFQNWTKRIPYVITAHGFPPRFKTRFGIPTPLVNWWARSWMRRGCNLAAAVVAPSRFVARELQRNGVKSDRISVLPLPISNEFASVQEQRQLEAADGSLMCLSVSPVNTAKGLDVLAEAIPRIVQEVPSARFVHVGKIQEPEVKEALDSAGNGNFSLRGPVSWPSISECYEPADIVIAPSRFETFGYTVLEAMVHGKPVVASEVGGLRDLIVNGETGFLIPPGDSRALADAVVRLLTDSDLRHKMGYAAARRADQVFGLEHFVRVKTALYLNVCKSELA